MPAQQIDHLDHLRQGSAALLEAADGNLDAPVPSCPDWTVADLVWHIGEVHHFWGAVAREGWATREAVSDGYEEPIRPADDALVAFATEQAVALGDALEDLDLDAPRWNWSPGAPDTGAFIPRRMALETAVHRVDAQLAAGAPRPIDGRLAADGIDEFLTVFLSAVREPYDGPTGIAVVLETDWGNAWALRLRPPVITVVGPGDLTTHDTEMERIWGSASEMLLLLWGRTERASLGPLGTALTGYTAAR